MAAATARVNVSAVARRPDGGAASLSGAAVAVHPRYALWCAGGVGNLAPRGASRGAAAAGVGAFTVVCPAPFGGAVASMNRSVASGLGVGLGSTLRPLGTGRLSAAYWFSLADGGTTSEKLSS